MLFFAISKILLERGLPYTLKSPNEQLMYTFLHFVVIKIILNWNTNMAAVTSCANYLHLKSCQLLFTLSIDRISFDTFLVEKMLNYECVTIYQKTTISYYANKVLSMLCCYLFILENTCMQKPSPC